MPGPSPTASAPPAPLAAYLHLLVAAVTGAEVPAADPAVRQSVDHLHMAATERAAVRGASEAARRLLPVGGDDLPSDLGDVPTGALAAAGLAAVAHAGHLMSYWGPVLDMGRRGQFTTHAEDMKKTVRRVEALERALRTRGEPVASEVVKRLVAALAEVEGAMPVETAKRAAARPEAPAYGSLRRESVDEGAHVNLSSSLASAPPPTRLTRERIQAEERRRAAGWFLVAATVLGLVLFLAFRLDTRVDPRDMKWYQRFAPVTSIERRPYFIEVRIDPSFRTRPAEARRASLTSVVAAFEEERQDLQVVSFLIGQDEIARWEEDRLDFKE